MTEFRGPHSVVTLADLGYEISKSESELDDRAMRLWERVRITPCHWMQQQYPGLSPFWVVAILGTRCLYLNDVEGGWGWGQFQEWGRISDYHCQDADLHHIIYQTLFAVDHGGAG